MFCIQRLNENFLRDDYRGFLELILLFLGGSPAGKIKFQPSGAYHLVRWMAKRIDFFKIVLFSDQFKIQKVKIHSMKYVIVKYYTQPWITAPNPGTVPMNNL